MRALLGTASDFCEVVVLKLGNVQATTYALLAGFQNFGEVAASQIGIFVTQVH